MAPIIISPQASYEDPVIAKNSAGVISKENLHILNEAALTASASTLSELEQEVGEDNVVNINGERQQSNLFEDEKNDSTRIKLPSIQTSYLGNEHRHEPSPQYYDSASAPLSLMQSFSPTQQITGGLEDININSPNSSQPQNDDNYALNMLNQYNVDEELARKLQDDQYTSDAALARQLQEEEDKKAPKTKVLPSVADSFLGPPNPMEVKSQYKRVNKGQSSSYSLSGISNWITSAATDFFGEDVNMQGHTRSSSSARGKKENNQYRNAV